MMELWWLVWLQISNVVHFNAIYTTLPTCYDSAMFVKLRIGWVKKDSRLRISHLVIAITVIHTYRYCLLKHLLAT